MSEEALKEFEGARNTQLQKNEARRMRTFVNQARGDIHRSANRWPFELTQNAHDPGPRPGLTEVNISLSYDGQTVVYEHDGKPFSMQDLAALQSGGSSKDFESKETTGRFGTGFLLTHVLAYQIEFDGILQAKRGFERVHLNLDRSGDEDTIYMNTLACNAAIGRASSLPILDGQKTARFKYVTDSDEAARVGIATFSKVLPHLYGTCEHLGQVALNIEDGRNRAFVSDVPTDTTDAGVHIWERKVTVIDSELSPKTLKVVRIRKYPDSPSSLVIVLEQEESSWRVVLPPPDFPRLFCRFPIRTSDFLPVNVIIDGRFEPSQERDSILMKEADKEQIADALDLLPALVQMALRKDWVDGFKLARVGMPTLVFGEPLDEVGKTWWKANLSSVAQRLAQLPIVKTQNGKFHKITDPFPRADFLVPRFDLNQRIDELDFRAVWELAGEVIATHPPALDIASEWTAISREWATLNVASSRLTLTKVGDLARHNAVNLTELKTTVAPLEWLSRFLNLVGQIADNHNCTAILTDILPDQNNVLKSPHSLKRDAGIEAELKDISNAIKLDVRNRLLSDELVAAGERPDLPHLRNLLENEISESLTNLAVIDECIQEVSKQLPDFKPIPADKQAYRDASIDLLHFLWNTQGVKAAELAQKCPLIASDGTSVRWSPQRKVMAPVSHWHPDAQPYAKVYKTDRVLADDYLTRFEDRILVDALVAWGIAFSDPLYVDTHNDLQGERLKAICSNSEVDGTIVGESVFSQIALLPTDLIQRCQSDEATAKLLFGLVLNYAARHDKLWKDSKVVGGRRNREEVPVTLTPALWIADLKSKAWVPFPGDSGGLSNVIANAATLEPLLDPQWLQGNDAAVGLLARFFGFRELELRLLATAPDEEQRKLVESGLSMLVQSLGADASLYSKLASDIEAKKLREEETRRNRKFGLAVQEAIKTCLESQGLNLTLVDRGYDYDVFLDDSPSIEAGTQHFQLADFLLEVKATTSGEVRLSTPQACTAATLPDRFILCVVDLRGITHDRMEGEWTAADVEPLTKILPSVGGLVERPRTFIESAKACDISLRNENALRYGVPVRVWESGMDVSQWVNLSLRKP